MSYPHCNRTKCVNGEFLHWAIDKTPSLERSEDLDTHVSITAQMDLIPTNIETGMKDKELQRDNDGEQCHNTPDDDAFLFHNRVMWPNYSLH